MKRGEDTSLEALVARIDASAPGATELLVAKNRNGPTGFVDLYFHARILRFEDMLDPA